jgi:hypothetical protein
MVPAGHSRLNFFSAGRRKAGGTGPSIALTEKLDKVTPTFAQIREEYLTDSHRRESADVFLIGSAQKEKGA